MVFLISIAGGTGSGKTTVAKTIAKVANKKDVLLFSLDNYYKDLSHLNLVEREKTNFDHPNSIDWKLLHKNLYDLMKKKNINMPVYSFKTHTRVGQIKIKPKKIIILEGIFALYDSKINKLVDLRLFVDTEADIRFIRRLGRDIKERARTPESVMNKWINQVKPMYDEFIEPTKKNAHIIIPEDPEGNMREKAIDLIKTKIKSL